MKSPMEYPNDIVEGIIGAQLGVPEVCYGREFVSLHACFENVATCCNYENLESFSRSLIKA